MRQPPGNRDPRRFARLDPERQRRVCLWILWRAPLIREALERLRDLDLPQWRIVSGALYNTLWNRLTGRPLETGIKDLDLFYFDAADLSYAAEDAVIRRVAAAFEGFPIPVETRNQARVHLWYEARFGQPYPPLPSTDAALERFASATHAIGLRLDAGERLDLIAPFGLRDALNLQLRPNRLLDNEATYCRKAARALAVWPELTVEPWRPNSGAQARP